MASTASLPALPGRKARLALARCTQAAGDSTRARLGLFFETRQTGTSGCADRYSRPPTWRGGEQRGVSHDPSPRDDDPGNDGHAALRAVCAGRGGSGRVGAPHASVLTTRAGCDESG
jgi:hypothetical protein